METGNYKIRLSKEQMEQRQKTIEGLKASKEVQAFLNKNHADESLLDKHSSLFVSWLKRKQQCAACQGLDLCTSNVQGRCKELIIDEYGLLTESYQPCRYEKKLLDDTSHSKNFLVSHLQEKDYLTSFQNLARTLDEQTKEYRDAFTMVLNSVRQGKGLMLYGQPGTGKTTLLIAAANALAKGGRKVAFVKVPRMMADLKETLEDKEYRQKLMNQLRRADVLFLDDLASERITAWTRDEILFPILDERMESGRPTYFSSNAKMEELEELYDCQSNAASRIAARRLKERVLTLSKPVELRGASRRY